MKYIRVRSYYPDDGTWTGNEQLYVVRADKAIERFKRDYPAHAELIITAEDYDPTKTPEHFEMCKWCGVVNYW